jgi:abhydrolase domain-containing protein 2
MSPFIVALIAFIFLLIFRILNVASQPQKPLLFYKDEKFASLLRESSPELEQVYIPTRVWGFSGHIQTVLHSLIGRMKCPWPIGERISILVDDGSTLTYDVYQPLDAHSSGEDVTLIMCPGICNSSESIYIRTFVHHAQRKGYRCTVLNHIGAMKEIRVTSHRIFGYGCTKDFHSMVAHVLDNYSHTKVVLVGFSMGANIVTKYLGDNKTHEIPKNILGGISICQGYDALSAMQHMLLWANFRRFYLYVMTENMKRVLIAHQQSVLSEEVKARYQLCERSILTAATLPEFDDAYTRRVHGYDNINDLYRYNSCSLYMENITVPMVFINALDDPIIPETLLTWPKNYAERRDKAAFILSTHGGHLGFYEGGFFKPNPVTWLDRTAVGIADGLLRDTHGKMLQ